MSMKIMKRSLALGALMAFVITGSAMAAENEENFEQTTGTLKLYESTSSDFTSTTIYDNITISSNVSGTPGVSMSGTKYLIANNKIDITGVYSGILAENQEWAVNSNLTVSAPEINIKVTDYNSGIHLDSKGAKVYVKNFNTFSIQSEDNDVSGIRVDDQETEVHVVGNPGSSIKINVGTTGVGLTAGGKEIELSADTIEITTKGRNTSTDKPYKATAVANTGGGTINILATKEISLTNTRNEAGKPKVAVYADNGSINIGTVAGAAEKADIIVTGDVKAKGNGAINLNLETSDSALNGFVLDTDITGEGKGTNLLLSNGAAWNNKGESNVTKLTMDNGVINQDVEEKITITSYSGNGTINYASKNVGDVFINDGSGSLNLAMVGETNLEEVAKKLSVKNSAADIKTQIVEAEGAVKGEVITEITYKEADPNTGYRMGTLGKTIEKANTTNASINNMLNVALMAWRAENNDMNKRLGELRDANGEHGVWVRMVNGESEYKDVENEYKTYQLGYDEKLSVDPSWTIGAAVSYTEGDTDAAKASGENKHKGFSIYGSKLNDDGSFVDLIAKVARIEHDFNVAGEKGDWNSNGYSFSAEYGKRLQQGNGLWIEPQVELTYGKISSAECELAGRNVTLEDMESLVGRVGFSLGKDIKQGNIYARASYLYDFEGETTTKFSDAQDSRSFEQDLGGGWWEVGVGANINLSKATYIYADVEKTFGGEVDTNWQWNLGVRYSF